MVNDNYKINLFLKKLNQNAPISETYKYPYKPILIISILESINNISDIFNNKIYLSNRLILKNYYNLISSNYELCELLKKQKAKQNWFATGFNKILEKVILSNIKQNPAKKLIDKNNDFYYFNEKENYIEFRINDISKSKDYKNLLLNAAYDCLKKCVPTYNNLSNSNILNYAHYELALLMYDNDTKIKNVRKYQHIFSKLVKDRDNKCLICCESNPYILEAAHIKPFSFCESIFEQYDENNGVTLCSNHHKMFDRGLFTFNNNWTVQISNFYKNDIKDSYLKFKEYEPCYSTITKNYPINHEAIVKYLKFRKENIFKQ